MLTGGRHISPTCIFPSCYTAPTLGCGQPGYPIDYVLLRPNPTVLTIGPGSLYWRDCEVIKKEPGFSCKTEVTVGMWHRADSTAPDRAFNCLVLDSMPIK